VAPPLDNVNASPPLDNRQSGTVQSRGAQHRVRAHQKSAFRDILDT
jgi:hypothetical protein